MQPSAVQRLVPGLRPFWPGVICSLLLTEKLRDFFLLSSLSSSQPVLCRCCRPPWRRVAGGLPAAVAPTPLHHVAYRQGFTVLINLRAVRPNITKEERYQFLLQDLAVDITTITDVFMVSSTQLLRVGFVTAEPCQAALDKLQGDVPWSAAGSARCTVGCLWILSPTFVILAVPKPLTLTGLSPIWLSMAKS